MPLSVDQRCTASTWRSVTACSAAPVAALGASAPKRRGSAVARVGIGEREAGPNDGDALAVGLDQRHVDAVDRRAAHQAKGAQEDEGIPGCRRGRPVLHARPFRTIAGQRDGSFKSDFMRIVHERGMVHQCSDAARLDELLATGVRTAYIGFDCTADSLHVGHLLQIMLLRWWQKTGHKPIALMGGGTTKVGDPSGRDETRQLLTPSRSTPTWRASRRASPTT